MIRNYAVFRALASILLVLVCATAGAQQGISDEAFEEMLSRWDFQIKQAQTNLIKSGASPKLLESIRIDVKKIQNETDEIASASKMEARKIRVLLEALGPAPAEDELAEEPSVAKRRDELQARLATFEGRVKQAELTAAQAKQLFARELRARRRQVAQELFLRGPSPISWSVISSAGPHFVSALSQLLHAPLQAWAPFLASGRYATVGYFFLAAAITFLIGWPLRRRILRHFVRDREVETPTFSRRVLTAVMVAIGRGVIPALIAALPLVAIVTGAPSRGIAADMIVAALIGLSAVVLASGVARAALAPASPVAWRPTPLTDASARALYRRFRRVFILIAVLFFIEFPARRHLHISEELKIFYNFVGDTVLAVFILALLQKRLWQTVESVEADEARRVAGTALTIQILRTIVAIAVVSSPLSSLLGFTNFANYLADNLLLTGLVVGAFIIFHGLAHDVFTLLLGQDESARGAGAEAGESSGKVLRFWLIGAVDFTLILAAAIGLLWAWGVGRTDFEDWMSVLLRGVKIGNFTLSFTDLIIAVIVFVAILFATRVLQRFLENRVFPQTRLDAGLRHSLKVATGYIGIVIAVTVAVSALGLDLSNLAIIFGALSVGIGFGLQNIVNNFVSGLILLVERPVKVGDWVVIGAHQGYVKRINVRATELQTFQRSSVIIPNSELLSSAVVNWTHKDTFARVDIPVGVAYGSDIELVRDTLLECAQEHPKANRYPEPFVLFQNFGDSSLDFELRFYISRADECFRVASEVRFAIVHGLNENGIQIPFPQRDIHVRSVAGGGVLTQTPKSEDPPSAGPMDGERKLSGGAPEDD
jgi:small-conductance mechanosensitive channel